MTAVAIPDWRREATPGMSLSAARGGYAPRIAIKPEQEAAGLPVQLSRSLAKILRPQAAYRWLLPQLAAITPQYIEMTLRGALAGNHVQQWELFDLMEDSWPRLMKNANALKNDVVTELGGWRARAYQDEDEPVSDTATEKAKLVNAALSGMRPKPSADENGLTGLIYDAMDAWLKGLAVQEVDWEVRSAGKLGQMIAPRAAFWVHPTCYAWSMQGELGLRLELANGTYALTPGVWQSTTMQPMPSEVAEFPEDKFLIAIHKAKSGTALGGALMRPLAWWWCAANFSADWLLNLAQLFGLPFRWANYDQNSPQQVIDSICAMLENMGSNAWAAFPAGTTLELKEPGKTGEHSPQADLLDRADRNCDLIVLGQTLTSDVSQKAGSRSQGEVHERVEEKIVVAAANWVATAILNEQLIPSILRLNYGDEDEKPTFRGDEEEEGTLEFKREIYKQFAMDGTLVDVLANQTDLKALTADVGLPINEEYVDPYLPVTDKNGAKINGATILDKDKDIVGGDTEAPEPAPAGGEQDPKANKEKLPPKGGVPLESRAPGGEATATGAPSAGFEENAHEALVKAIASDLAPLRERLESILAIGDPAILEIRLRAFLGDLDKLKEDMLADPATAHELQKVVAAGVANGLSSGRSVKARSGGGAVSSELMAGDVPGHEFRGNQWTAANAIEMARLRSEADSARAKAHEAEYRPGELSDEDHARVADLHREAREKYRAAAKYAKDRGNRPTAKVMNQKARYHSEGHLYHAKLYKNVE